MSERLALIVANSHYQDQALVSQETPAASLHALASVLRDPNIGNFSSVETLFDQPTQEIQRQIRDLFHRRKKHDLILLYVFGHGVLDDGGHLFLASPDTELDSLQETAIPAAYITDCMDRSFSRQQILILDCVHIAAFTQGARVELGSSVSTGPAFEGKGYWRAVLTSNDATQIAWTGGELLGDAKQPGFFTRYIIQGLGTGAADLDGDGRVEIGELYAYIQDQFLQQPSAPEPHKWRYNEREKFYIARNPKLAGRRQPILWDVLIGAVMAPLVTVFLGRYADLSDSIGLAGILLLLYALLYWGLSIET